MIPIISNIKTINYTSTEKCISYPNGFQFFYTINQTDNQDPLFLFKEVMFNNEKYNFISTEQDLNIFKSLSFIDYKSICSHLIPVDKYFNSVESILKFTDFNLLIKGILGDLKFLYTKDNEILTKTIPINHFSFCDNIKNRLNVFKNIETWLKSNPDKIQIVEKLDIQVSPYDYTDHDLYIIKSGLIIVHDEDLLFNNMSKDNNGLISLHSFMENIFNYILDQINIDNNKRVLAINFASPLIIAKARDCISQKSLASLDNIDDYFIDLESKIYKIFENGIDFTDSDFYKYWDTVLGGDLLEYPSSVLVLLTVLEILHNKGSLLE